MTASCFYYTIVHCACEYIRWNCNRLRTYKCHMHSCDVSWSSLHFLFVLCRHLCCAVLYHIIFISTTAASLLLPDLCFLEKIYNLKLFFFLFFYQKGKSSRIRFYFRNKVRFHGRKKQSLGVEKVCSFSIALLKCPYALINLSMFGSS